MYLFLYLELEPVWEMLPSILSYNSNFHKRGVGWQSILSQVLSERYREPLIACMAKTTGQDTPTHQLDIKRSVYGSLVLILP